MAQVRVGLEVPLEHLMDLLLDINLHVDGVLNSTGLLSCWACDSKGASEAFIINHLNFLTLSP